MLVQCPQCGAAYDFPDERVTAKGLKAACGRCKLVMLVKPAGPDGKAVVEVPPSPRQTQVKRPKRRAAPVQHRPSKSERPKRTDSIVSSTRRSEVPAEDAEPSIVVDMGHFNDTPEPPAPEPLTPEEEEARRLAESAAAFAPLSVAPVQLSNPRYAPPMPTVIDDDGEVPVIRQAMFLKTFLVLVFLGAIGFVLFVAWKNNWGPIWEDPSGAVRTALNLQAPPSEAPVAIVEPQDTGALGVDDPKLEWIDARTVLISGTVNNRSSRIHHAIGLDVALMRGDLPLGARVVPCCAALSIEEAKTIARDPKHAHFDASQRTGQVSLKPGETARFSAILIGLPADAKDGDPQAKVGIKYSDPERITP